MIPFLAGERVLLRALTPEDAAGNYLGWLNDAEVCRYNGHHRYPYTRDQAEAYITSVTGAGGDLVLAVVDRASGEHVGNISIQNLDPLSRVGEFAILMGEKEFWGKGLAREAAVLIIQHAFRELNLHRIHCGTFADNAGMKKLAAALGMTEEGRRREAVFKDGRYHDLIEYGLLRQEFEQKAENGRR